MEEIDNVMLNSEYVLKSKKEFDEQFRQITSGEQLYSIALFDILGFSNFVENNGNKRF